MDPLKDDGPPRMAARANRLCVGQPGFRSMCAGYRRGGHLHESGDLHESGAIFARETSDRSVVVVRVLGLLRGAMIRCCSGSHGVTPWVRNGSQRSDDSLEVTEGSNLRCQRAWSNPLLKE